MLWLKALHIITMVAWFSGLFYLPRLFVYHSESTDKISLDRFKIMEYRLYYFITTPAAVLTIVFGTWLLTFVAPLYAQQGWLHLKMFLVLLLLGYHVYLGICLKQFNQERNQHSSKFYRILNEIPTLFLISMVILAVIKPF